MLFRLNTSSGVPVYLQLVEQVIHAAATGAIRPGEQLPAIRRLAEELVINPNTIIRAYHELQHRGVIELRHGSGAFVRERPARAPRIGRREQALVQSAVERLHAAGLGEEEIRRLFEHALGGLRARQQKEDQHA